MWTGTVLSVKAFHSFYCRIVLLTCKTTKLRVYYLDVYKLLFCCCSHLPFRLPSSSFCVQCCPTFLFSSLFILSFTSVLLHSFIYSRLLVFSLSFSDGVITKEEMKNYFLKVNSQNLSREFSHNFQETTYFTVTLCHHCGGVVRLWPSQQHFWQLFH